MQCCGSIHETLQGHFSLSKDTNSELIKLLNEFDSPIYIYLLISFHMLLQQAYLAMI